MNEHQNQSITSQRTHLENVRTRNQCKGFQSWKALQATAILFRRCEARQRFSMDDFNGSQIIFNYNRLMLKFFFTLCTTELITGVKCKAAMVGVTPPFSASNQPAARKRWTLLSLFLPFLPSVSVSFLFVSLFLLPFFLTFLMGEIKMGILFFPYIVLRKRTYVSRETPNVNCAVSLFLPTKSDLKQY